MNLLLYIVMWFHPFFLSVIEAEYNKAEKSIGISCKIFNDDLENTLKRSSGQPVDILHGDKNKNLVLLQHYYERHFRVLVDQKQSIYRILGYEQENDVIYLFFEVRNVAPFSSVTIDTDQLYDNNKGQINLVHFLKGGKRETQRLTYPDTKAEFRW